MLFDMFKRRRLNKVNSSMRLGDSTRRRIAKKVTRSKLTKRRLKQIPMRFEELEPVI